MEYAHFTYNKLQNIMTEATQKGKAGTLRREEAAIATAAAYAIDLIDISKDAGKELSLTIMGEDVIAECLIRAHFSNMHEGKTIKESRENLIKLLGGYELFAILNSCNIDRKIVEIVVVRNVMTPEIKLVIESLPNKEGKQYRFDVYEAARQTIDEFELQDFDGISHGRLLTFHNRLLNEFLKNV